MPLHNLREDLVYGLLPPTVADLDWRKLIQAVVGGYQDRLGDLRSYVSRLEKLLDPTYVDRGVVLVTFLTDGGIESTISLSVEDGTPEDGEALLAWAADQLDVEPGRVTQAVRGSDMLRVVPVDTLQLLAATIGATLYPGVAGETPAEVAVRRRKIVESYFPRLKFKGTARSWVDAAKLHGFSDASLTPLWTRYDGSSGRSFPDVYPGQPGYAGLDLNDGPWTTWQSGSLYSDPTNPAYYTSVNGKNPLVRIRVTGSAQPPPVGTYELSAGGPQVAASVRLANGTVDSQLVVEAAGLGDGYDRTTVVVTGQNDWRKLDVAGWASLIKYRASTYDAAVFRWAPEAGTQVVGPNASLRTGLSLPDGTATAPWRPWSGGSGAPLTQTLWPVKVAVYGAPVGTRDPADSTKAQYDSVTLLNDAQGAFASLLSTQPATRLPQRLTPGLMTADQAGFRNYPGLYNLFVGPGSLGGVVPDDSLPAVSSVATVIVGGVSTPTAQVGSFSQFYGATVGSIDNHTGAWYVSTQLPGTVVARFTPTDQDYLPPTVVPLAQTLRLSRPAGTTYDTIGTISTADDAAWLRYRPLMTGGQVETLVYSPTMGDPTVPDTSTPVVLAQTQAGVMGQLVARDFASYQTPYRVVVDETTPLSNRPRKPALAELAGERYPVTAIHGAVLVSSVADSLPRRQAQRLWWWLGEDPTDKLTVRDLVTGYDSPLVGAKPNQRTLSPARGWFLNGPGTVISPPIEDLETVTVGGWLKASPADTELVRAGQVAVRSAAGTRFCAVLDLDHDTTVATGELEVSPGTLTYAAASLSGGQLSLRLRRAVNVWSEVGVAITEPAATWPYARLSLPPESAASDVVVWSAGKTTAELGTVADPDLYATKVAWPTPWITSARGDRYGLTTTAAGQVLPGTAVPEVNYSLVATVNRYNSAGSFTDDPEYKLAGLGQRGNVGQTQFKLGQEGAFISATGRHILFGSNSVLPAYTTSWVGTTFTQRYRVAPPYGTAGGVVGTFAGDSDLDTYDANNVLDRIYLRGSNATDIYQCQLDDFGNGPVFTVVQPIRYNSPGSIRDYPTDHRATFVAGETAMMVENNQVVMQSGQGGYMIREVGEGYILLEDGGRIELTDPAYGLVNNFNMYLRSRQRAAVLQAGSRWANKPPGTSDTATPTLEDAGTLSFTNTEQVAAGTVRLTFNIANDGWLDDDFPGFEVSVSVDGPGAEPVSAQATWMAGAKGYNQTARVQVELVTDTAVTGPWNLSVTWSNPKVLPARGRRRRLQILSYEVREVKTELCLVTLVPFAVNRISTDIVMTPLQAGAWVGLVNQAGSTTTLVHESRVYSPNPDRDGVPRVSASDAIAGSSLARFASLDVISPPQALPPVTPALPVIYSVGTNPSLATYNVGDEVTLSAVASGADLRYTWRFWNYGTSSSYENSAAAVLNRGGPAPWRLLAVDKLGRTAAQYGTIYVNQPPTLALATATPNNLPAPYVTNLQAVVSDAELQPVTVSWYDAGSLIAVGTSVGGVTVNGPRNLRIYAIDSAGGTTTSDLPIYASTNLRPTVALSDYTAKAKANWDTRLSFAAVAQDPEGRGLSATWNWWDGTATAGYAVAMPQFGNGTLFTVERQAVASAGYKLFNITVSDQSGLSATAGAGVTFSNNSVPQIDFARVSAPTVAAGDPLYLSAAAYDSDGDTLSYIWDIAPIGIKLYGPNAVFNSFGTAPGTTLGIKLTVTDGFGGQAVAELPAVTVAYPGSSLRPITIDPPSGLRTSGAAITISSPDQAPVDIRYTIDGSTPFSATDGLPYSAPFMLGYAAGNTVNIKARAFKGTWAPSPVADVTYTFTV